MHRVYSKELIEAWKRALIETYGFEEYMDFLIQPTLTGKKYLTYLPHINYTDRTTDQIDDLLEIAKDTNYHIRVLNPHYRDFKDDDTVTLRMHVTDSDSLLKGYKRLARRSILQCKKSQNISFKKNEIEKFYSIIKAVYKRHGTPIFPPSLLYNLQKTLQNKIEFFIFYYHATPVAGYMIFIDQQILTFQIGGMLQSFKTAHAGYYLYHTIIVDILQRHSIDIVDFGRSPYNGGTYFFKTRFGAQPIKIDIITHDTKNIYKAYTLAANIWKRLPSALTDRIGPKLTKYLVDL